MSEKRRITAEDRKRIVEKSLEEILVKDISSMLSLKYFTVWRIVNQFDRTDDVSAKKRGADTRSTLSQKQKNEVLLWVDNNCLLKLKDLVVKVKEKLNVLTCKSTIDRILHEFHYTMKSTVLVPEQLTLGNSMQRNLENWRQKQNIQILFF